MLLIFNTFFYSRANAVTVNKETVETKPKTGKIGRPRLGESSGKSSSVNRKPHKIKPSRMSKKKSKLYCICQTPYDDSKYDIPRIILQQTDTFFIIFFLFIPDFMLVVIYVIIGSMANVWKLPKKKVKKCLNLFAPSVSMHVIHKNCIASVENHTMHHNFIYAVTNARTGSMVDVLEYCKVKPIVLMNTYVQIVNVVTL